MATDSRGPPGTSPRGGDERANLPQMPPTGPPALAVHGPTAPGRKGHCRTAPAVTFFYLSFFSLWSFLVPYHLNFPLLTTFISMNIFQMGITKTQDSGLGELKLGKFTRGSPFCRLLLSCFPSFRIFRRGVGF
jgi:hypothetical protein